MIWVGTLSRRPREDRPVVREARRASSTTRQSAQPRPQRHPDADRAPAATGSGSRSRTAASIASTSASRTFPHNVYDPNNPTGLNNNSIWALLEDRTGTLWAGTFAGGINVAKRNSEAIRTYRSVPGDTRA